MKMKGIHQDDIYIGMRVTCISAFENNTSAIGKSGSASTNKYFTHLVPEDPGVVTLI